MILGAYDTNYKPQKLNVHHATIRVVFWCSFMHDSIAGRRSFDLYRYFYAMGVLELCFFYASAGVGD